MNTDPESEEIQRLKEVRSAYAKEAEKAERDLVRAQARLEAARMKVSVADDMIAKVQNLPTQPAAAGAAFAGFGKYAGKPISEALLDVITTHAGPLGMSVNDIRQILINEGLGNTRNLGVAIHVIAGRLAAKHQIQILETDEGKRFAKPIISEHPSAAA